MIEQGMIEQGVIEQGMIEQGVIELSAAQARRIAVAAALLGTPRPADLLEVARGLAAVQVDATSYVAPSAEIVFWSRLGRRFAAPDLTDAVESRRLVEHRSFLRPAEDLALFTAEMAAWPGVHPAGWQAAMARWVEVNDAAREAILGALRSDGPLAAREIDVPFKRDWKSSGWNNTKNVPMMLERLEERGEVAVSHRAGRERVWDLAERIYPHETPVPLADALRIRAERRLAYLGVARAQGPGCSTEPVDVGEVGVRAVIEGTRGEWRVDPALLEGGFRGRVALLSPLDRLVFDRKRMDDLWRFDYALEMYKPAAVRQWGYFALPVLSGADLVGKVDVEADRRGGLLRVHALHEDVAWSASVRDGVEREIRSLGTLVGLEVVDER